MWFIGLTVITLSVVLNIAVFVSVKGILGEVYLLHTGFAGSVQCLYKVSGCGGGMVDCWPSDRWSGYSTGDTSLTGWLGGTFGYGYRSRLYGFSVR